MFDLAPLYRSTIGFDRLAPHARRFVGASRRPPIRPTTSRSWARMNTASPWRWPGSAEDELQYRAQAEHADHLGQEVRASRRARAKFLHQGIASRAFERRFQLADFVEVRGASLENGLLHVTLKREIPEAMKPRTIAVNGKSPKSIEGKKAA